MNLENEAGSSSDLAVDDASSKINKGLKAKYDKEFLLSLSELECCKNLPRGFDRSLLSEFEKGSYVHGRLRTRSNLPSQGGYRRPEYGSPPTRGDPDPGKRFGNQSRKTWRGAEQDGLLGSGPFPRPPGMPAPKESMSKSSDSGSSASSRTTRYYDIRTKIPKPLRPQVPTSDFSPLTYSNVAQTPYSKLVHTPILRPQYTVLTPNTPRSMQPIPQDQSTTSQAQTTSYFLKSNPEYILQTHFHTEPEIPHLKSYVARLFLPQCQWIADDIQKTQQFYELILIDTNSVEIQYIHNKNDPNRIDYSKIYIKQVLHPRQFTNIHSNRNFSVQFIPQGFNYANYIQAWFKTFYVRSFDHSWFINFHPQFNNDVPMWFFDCFKNFGPVKEIYPPAVSEGYDMFHKISTAEDFRKPFLFHSSFRVPWIFAWSFEIKHVHSNTPCSLVRQFKVKWWNNYNNEFCSSKAVIHFLQTGQKLKIQFPQPDRQLQSPIQIALQHGSQQIAVQPATPVAISHSKSPEPVNIEDDEDFKNVLEIYRSIKKKEKLKEEIKIEDAEDPFGGLMTQDPFEF